MTHRVALLAGDGVGPEVTAEARKAVDALGVTVEWTELPWGSAYWHEHGRMMPEDALEVVRAHDAILMGAVGDPSVPALAARIGNTRSATALDLWGDRLGGAVVAAQLLFDRLTQILYQVETVGHLPCLRRALPGPPGIETAAVPTISKQRAILPRRIPFT